ncbi:PilT/PilU family type 4a pilus ATPase [uncultured Fusobacterium sp.]|uniref:type IV pilus twitching motility protein PilT n=1 Tax=uncultured Fusobacterium sp. TaxID=159267 RepID=UPI002804FB67|nr:PilT/PilU family type 4a pilus ATPase [uncultured Fusobacterium sp.]
MNEFDKILKDAQKEEVSDIHILTGEKIVFRKQGKLERKDYNIPNCDDIEKWIENILSKDEKIRYLQEKDIDLSYENSFGRYRINMYFEKSFLAIAIRVLKKEIKNLSLEEYPEILKEIVKYKNGLVLITGTTGSGKSTTLATMIEEINMKYEKSILTIEDPIEYIFKNKKSIIRQREIGKDTNSFATGLRAALRQDPDIIMVGELRDLESIEIALTIAETGHLVLGTLHTNSASSTINRIVDVFPAEKQEQIRVQLSMNLRCVVTQQLVNSKDGKRIPAFEILVVTPAVANQILNNKINQIDSFIETGKKFGMISMRESLEILRKKGKI